MCYLGNYLGRSHFGPKRSNLHHISPFFSNDALHRPQKTARLALICLLFGLKTADLISYFVWDTQIVFDPDANVKKNESAKEPSGRKPNLKG
jgi:hypothetical protein